jgi:hypothetical protein
MAEKAQTFSVKNWEKFQHYSKRTPPWIKLHRDLLNDYEFSRLRDASKVQLVLIWLLASQMDNKVPADAKWLKGKLCLDVEPNLKELKDKGFIEYDSEALAPRKQSATPETEREAEEETKSEAFFTLFWSAYPKKRNKGDAEKAFKKLNPDELLFQKILNAVEAAKFSPDWKKEEGKFIPYPASWIRAQGWEDEIIVGTITPIRPRKELTND